MGCISFVMFSHKIGPLRRIFGYGSAANGESNKSKWLMFGFKFVAIVIPYFAYAEFEKLAI